MASTEPHENAQPNGQGGSTRSTRSNRLAPVSFLLSLVPVPVVGLFLLTIVHAAPVQVEAALLLTQATVGLLASAAAVITGILGAASAANQSSKLGSGLGWAVSGLVIGMLGGIVSVLGLIIALAVLSCVTEC